jgi:hypothetical protein
MSTNPNSIEFWARDLYFRPHTERIAESETYGDKRPRYELFTYLPKRQVFIIPAHTEWVPQSKYIRDIHKKEVLEIKEGRKMNQ